MRASLAAATPLHSSVIVFFRFQTPTYQETPSTHFYILLTTVTETSAKSQLGQGMGKDTPKGKPRSGPLSLKCAISQDDVATLSILGMRFA